MNSKSHLSYIQIMIIAIVLGVAARMIAPQFTQATVEEQGISKLVKGLEEVRIQLDLYLVHHKGTLPPTDSFSGFEAAFTTKKGKYNPMLAEIPENPFNGLKTVRFDGEPAGSNNAGWRLDTKTGFFQADNDLCCAAL